jgi:hypothetical protein
MRNTIGTMGELIAGLGGDAAVAEMCGLRPSEVRLDWRARKHVPPGWSLQLFVEVLRQGLDVDLVLLGLSPDDAAFLRDRVITSLVDMRRRGHGLGRARV